MRRNEAEASFARLVWGRLQKDVAPDIAPIPAQYQQGCTATQWQPVSGAGFATADQFFTRAKSGAGG